MTQSKPGPLPPCHESFNKVRQMADWTCSIQLTIKLEWLYCKRSHIQQHQDARVCKPWHTDKEDTLASIACRGEFTGAQASLKTHWSRGCEGHRCGVQAVIIDSAHL